MKSLKVNVVNHKGMTLEVNLISSDTDGFTFEFACKNADGTPLAEFDREEDDFFGTMELLYNHVNSIADFLDSQGEAAFVDKGVVN